MNHPELLVSVESLLSAIIQNSSTKFQIKLSWISTDSRHLLNFWFCFKLKSSLNHFLVIFDILNFPQRFLTKYKILFWILGAFLAFVWVECECKVLVNESSPRDKIGDNYGILALTIITSWESFSISLVKLVSLCSFLSLPVTFEVLFCTILFVQRFHLACTISEKIPLHFFDLHFLGKLISHVSDHFSLKYSLYF